MYPIVSAFIILVLSGFTPPFLRRNRHLYSHVLLKSPSNPMKTIIFPHKYPHISINSQECPPVHTKMSSSRAFPIRCRCCATSSPRQREKHLASSRLTLAVRCLGDINVASHPGSVERWRWMDI